MGARLRWTVSAALAAAAAVLGFSMLDRDPHPGAAGAASESVTPSETTPAESSTPLVTATAQTTAPATPEANDGPPLRPDAANGLTIAAAESLVRYYFAEAGNYLKLTGDASAWTRASSPACSFCSGNARYFGFANGRSKRLTGAFVWRDVDVRIVRSTGARSAVVDVNVRTGRHAAVEKRGAPAKRFPGGVQYYKVSLVELGGDWVVLDVVFR
ncbi:MAG TPA: DUF6318 family protein [Kribbellaceae bacterium]|nr:DUF6318 family protein [Kribbellaceae bacterium]